MTFALLGVEAESQLGKGPYCFRIHGRIYHLVSPLYPKEANKSGYRQFYILDPAEAKTKQIKNHSDQGYMAELMQWLVEMLRQLNPFAES
jgi:hypothetical protein